MLPSNVLKLIEGMVEIKEEKVAVVIESQLQSDQWDELVNMAVFGEEEEKVAAKWLIWEVGQGNGQIIWQSDLSIPWEYYL